MLKEQEATIVAKALEKKTKTIAIHSYRGGTGKSNIAVNIGYLLAVKGYKIGLIDFDLPSPGLNLILGAQPKHTINEAIREEKGRKRPPVKDIPIEVSAPDAKKKLWLASAANDSKSISEIVSNPPSLCELYDFLDDLKQYGGFDYLIIDTHPGVNKNTLLALASSDQTVTVVRPDRQDYEGTRILLRLLHELKVKPEQATILVNKAPNNVNILKEQLVKHFRQAVVGVLPMSLNLAQFGSKGIFCAAHPLDPWTQELTRAKEYLI